MISFIVAMDKNQLIGQNNDLPWHLPADLAHFKKVTSHHTIVMGRKTYESIGRPLPNRRNVILTRKKDYDVDGCDIVHTIDEVVAIAEQEDETFIIGGNEVFQLFFEHAKRLYITHIDEAFEGDTYFPEMDEADWELVSVEQGQIDEKNKYRHEFRRYERKQV